LPPRGFCRQKLAVGDFFRLALTHAPAAVARVYETNKVMFDGLRFADNNYVLGSIDLGTHQVRTVATSSVKWADLQTFG
jgi:hypothetical protein